MNSIFMYIHSVVEDYFPEMMRAANCSSNNRRVCRSSKMFIFMVLDKSRCESCANEHEITAHLLIDQARPNSDKSKCGKKMTCKLEHGC